MAIVARQAAARATSWDMLATWIEHRHHRTVTKVAVSAISGSFSPRAKNADPRHVAMLAQSPIPLPPIVIHRSSMRVVDGVHRLHAIVARGRDEILAQFFDGGEEDAAALAVGLNHVHGLPLTLAERKAAAQKLLTAQPEWSGRSIALIAGLSPKTVAKMRQLASEESVSVSHRRGIDGRNRPLRPAEGRRRAARYMIDNPSASLRQVAREAQVSVGTARDVRKRLANSDDPVPAGQDRHGRSNCRDHKAAQALADTAHPRDCGAHPLTAAGSGDVDGPALLQRLRRDPSVKYSQRGKAILRLLTTASTGPEGCQRFADEASQFSAGLLANLARHNAHEWAKLAAKFETTATRAPQAQ